MEAVVKNVNNAINTMLNVQNELASLNVATPSGTVWQEDLPIASQEQTLEIVEHCILSFGIEALQELEEQIEKLQEEFLALLHSLLQAKKIKLKEKLVLSLCSENTLLLQCYEHEESLLAALGENESLNTRLKELRSKALLAQGLNYLLNAKNLNTLKDIPQYKICIKGALSHFYLK